MAVMENSEDHSIQLCVTQNVILSLKLQEIGPNSERLIVMTDDRILSIQLLWNCLGYEKVTNIHQTKGGFRDLIL
jgi:hypothetical protein